MTSVVSVSAVADAAHALQELAITTPDHTGEVTDTAAHRVFRIPELFDLILFRLGSKQHFLRRRVNRMWRDYISTSTILKREMFLLSGPATSHLATVKLNPWLGSREYFYLDNVRRSSLLPDTSWRNPESLLSKTLLVRPVRKDARLSILLRIEDFMNYHAPQRLLRMQIEPESTLEDVEKAIEAAAMDKTREQVISFSVFSTRVYADGVWRGDDLIAHEVVQHESSVQERRYRVEWKRYEQ
ncbi:hypothetical protein LTR56_009027 [Elasticomyces elasticus]|nr:hypothetical protein LTR56_009027 [Elasticomyces elasticus]KAK3663828.1 hypothetical protein LTR22_005289 [Elasticomyces elasticus]KAK4923964.1 hypothetical protein LTR49_008909 [Elasticomyces elasticus]KAK5762160.1 hypothetical protein LTS12_007681 [Elasticomyces elasticus]